MTSSLRAGLLKGLIAYPVDKNTFTFCILTNIKSNGKYLLYIYNSISYVVLKMHKY